MGREQKQFKQLTSAESLALAEQELQGGNAKEALNRALSCFKAVPGVEQRSLLERAYVARIRELAATGVVDRALERFYEFMQLDPQLPEVVAELPTLRVRLGIGTAADQTVVAQAAPELARVMFIEQADRAVLRQQPVSDPAIQAEVDKVREALLAIELGDESRANDSRAEQLLKDISRASPLADWKLFARGLSSFYQREIERARANWDRLTPQRPAWRIAQTLLVVGGHHPAPEAVQSEIATSVRRLKNATSSSSWAAELEQLATTWKSRRWRDFFYRLRDLKQRGGEARIQLLSEIGELAWRRLAREGRSHELEKLISLIPGLPMDLDCSRARALVAEHQEDVDLDEVEKLWQKYLEQIPNVAAVKDSQRPLVTALVYRHLANVFGRASEEYLGPNYDQNVSQGTRLRSRAVAHFRNSVKHDPALANTYLDWIKLHQKGHQLDEAAEVYEQFARNVPDQWEAHDWLASYYLAEDEADRAAPHVAELVRLRPREPGTQVHLWNQQVSAIRILAKKRQFAAAREAIGKLETIVTSDTQRLYADLIRASVEYKAKEVAAAEAYVAKAVAQVAEPTIVWMILSSNAAKYGIDKGFKKDFDTRLKAALDVSPTSNTAARLAEYLHNQAGKSSRYTGHATHLRLTVKYIERCRNIAWAPDELRTVCRFLMAMRRADRLIDLLLEHGERLFPDDPYFPAMIGHLEMDYGPFRCNHSLARKKLQRAVDLNHSAIHPLLQAELELVQTGLAILEQVSERYGNWSDDEDDFDDDEYGDENDDGESDTTFPEERSRSGTKAPSPTSMLPLVSMLLEVLTPKMRREWETDAAKQGLSLEELMARVLAGKT